MRFSVVPKNTGPAPSWALRNSTLRCIRLARSLSSCHDTSSTIPSHRDQTRCTETPCRIRATVILQRIFGWFVHGLHGLLGFALLPDCNRTFRLASQGECVGLCPPVRKVWPDQLPKGKAKSAGFFFSVWVCWLLLRAGRVASPRRDFLPSTITHQNPKIKNKRARTQKNTYQNKIQRCARTKQHIQHNKKPTTKYEKNQKTKTYDIHIRPKIQSVGRSSGQVHKGFC